MKRLSVLPLAFVALAALLGSCGGGGEEEVATLAVAFRLDEGSPVMAAYIGDPTEDPWQLPAGRYYIEALDQDDVLLSLGAVDIDSGDIVEFPPSFEAAGGVADPEQAEPLITLASFVIDLELAKSEFLEIVTAGFTESPFGSAVGRDDASVQQLFEMYGDIAAQEDAVLAALSNIEGRLGVSSGVSYVCSPWASAPDDLDLTETQVAFLVALLIRAQQMGEAADSPAEVCQEGACWVIPLEADRFEGYAKGQFWIRRTPETLAMFNKWQEYAGKLVQDLGLTPDKSSPGQVQKGLMEKVRSDFQKWAPNFGPPELIDEIVDFFVNEVAKVVPQLASAPAGGPAQAKADTSWIEGLVQKVADKLLEEGHSGLDVAVWADDLELCLTAQVEQGLSQENATAVCVWLFDKLIAPGLESMVKELAEPAEPEPGEPVEPEPGEPVEPEPEDTLEGVEVTAVGRFVGPLPAGWQRVTNTITIRFNTAGGPGTVSGDSERVDRELDPDDGSVRAVQTLHIEFTGSYSPDTRQLSGTVHVTGTVVFMEEGQIFSETPLDFPAVWSATWDGATVTGSVDGMGPFELTVQG